MRKLGFLLITSGATLMAMAGAMELWRILSDGV